MYFYRKRPENELFTTSLCELEAIIEEKHEDSVTLEVETTIDTPGNWNAIVFLKCFRILLMYFLKPRAMFSYLKDLTTTK